MTHPLDGMLVKLRRADEHFQAIQSDIESLVHAHVDLIPNEFDPQSGQHVFRAQRDSLSPEWLGPVIGDCVHNLRAALDYLVWELVAAAGNIGTTGNEFPIFSDPKLYARRARTKLLGVAPKAIPIFEELQPFYGANSDPLNPDWRDPTREPLALLYALDIRDKHRALNLTEGVLSVRLVGAHDLRVMPPPVIMTLVGNFKTGAVVARMHGSDLRPEMQVQLRATTDIAFDREGPAGGENVIQTLDDIRKTIRRKVIPPFRKFFPSPLPPGIE